MGQPYLEMHSMNLAGAVFCRVLNRGIASLRWVPLVQLSEISMAKYAIVESLRLGAVSTYYDSDLNPRRLCAPQSKSLRVTIDSHTMSMINQYLTFQGPIVPASSFMRKVS
jgi:hypothetical protein